MGHLYPPPASQEMAAEKAWRDGCGGGTSGAAGKVGGILGMQRRVSPLVSSQVDTEGEPAVGQVKPSAAF